MGRSHTDGRTQRSDGERGDGGRGAGRARGSFPAPKHLRAGGGTGTRSGETGRADGSASSSCAIPSTGERLTGSLLPAAGARLRCRRLRYRRASSKAVSPALVHPMARVGAGRATVLPDRSVMRRYDIRARAWSVSCLVKARRVSVRTLPSEPME